MVLVFELNPYAKFVANTMVVGVKFTIFWCVYDNKVLHVKYYILDYIVYKVAKNSGRLSIKRGKKSVFLCMNIEMNDDVKINIGMKEYIKDSVEMFDEYFMTPVASEAHGNLTKIW